MTVSQIINCKEFENVFEKYINYPKVEIEKEILYKNPKNHDLIGHAYEILFQLFYLKYKGINDIYRLKCFREYSNFNFLQSTVSVIFENKLKKIILKYRTIENRIREFVINKELKIDRRILKDILFLAKLLIHKEEIYNIRKVNKKDIRDLKELIKGLKNFKRIFNEKLCFNVFLNHYNLIGEADFIYNKVLVDIKTITENKITKKHINQLVLYYILLKKNNYKINEIAILFSRYGEICFFSIKDIISEKGEKKLEKKIFKYFDKKESL